MSAGVVERAIGIDGGVGHVPSVGVPDGEDNEKGGWKEERELCGGGRMRCLRFFEITLVYTWKRGVSATRLILMNDDLHSRM